MKKIAWYFVFVFGIISSVNGQNLTIDFQHLYSKDGLSSNTIYALCRDSFGFLWIGTEDGLNRFDGSNFKIYRRNPNESDGLGVNHVTSLYEDRKGRIWIGTNGGGVAYYDRNTDRIQHYKPNNVEGVSTAINSIAGDAQGNIWVSAYGSIYCIDVETTAVLTKAAYQKISKQLRDRISSYTFKDKNENLWIASDQMIYRYDPQLKLESVYKLPSEGGARRSDPLVRGIVEDGNGFMWFVSTEGLFRLDEHRTKLQSSAYLLKDQQMHSNNLYAVDVDKSGNLWIGSDKGLHILDINTFKLDYYRPNRSNLYSLSTRSIRSILIDDFGISWVGTYQGGLNKYDNNLNEFNLRTVAGGQLYAGESAIVTSLAASRNQIYIGTDGKGVLAYNKTTGNQEQIGNLPKELAVLAMEPDNQILWIGTYRNGLYGYNLETKGYHHVVAGTAQNQLNNDEIFALKKDRKGNLWIGTNGGGVNVLSPDRKSVLKYESLRYVRAIEEVSEEQIWVGTYGTGISIINPATRELRSINAQSHHLPSNYILSIHRDRIGNIWVGTNGDGVGILKKGDSKFQTISINDGLLNGVVQKIIEDDDGKMWFSTGQGLSCYDIASKSFKNYSHSSGLQAGSFSLGAGIKMSDGELYFGGQQGFNYFYPQNLKTNQNPAQVVLTNLRINNTIVNPGKDQPIATSMLLEKQIRLRHDQNFSISFEALNFTVPEDNQYA